MTDKLIPTVDAEDLEKRLFELFDLTRAGAIPVEQAKVALTAADKIYRGASLRMQYARHRKETADIKSLNGRDNK